MPEAGISPDLTLWMFDFDGTLSPLAADRTAAILDPNCRDMLHQLAAVRGLHCAVISSRLLSDLEDRVDVPGIFLCGGSGLEWRLPDGRLQAPEADQRDAIRKVRKTLIPEIMEWGLLPGLEIEDKQWSVAIHIRRTTQQTQRELATHIDLATFGDDAKIKKFLIDSPSARIPYTDSNATKRRMEADGRGLKVHEKHPGKCNMILNFMGDYLHGA